MIWIVFALMTGAVVFCVLWPLARAPHGVSRRDGEIAFYKAQLAEIERDVARGVASPLDADGSRALAARRLLEADRTGKSIPPPSPWTRRWAAIAAIALIPAISLSIYLHIGNPDLPDEPLAARLNAPPGKMDVNVMLAKIERHLAKDPNDGRGWSVIAPVYLRLGRANKAADAYAHAIRALGDNASLETGLGTALVYANNGQIGDKARQAFQSALRLDPSAVAPQFYLGSAAEQVGDKAKAIAIWSKLLRHAPPGAPWASALKAQIAALKKKSVPNGAAAAIAALPPAQQAAAIRSMVGNLAARLAKNGGAVADWSRLIRAYVVLHETDKARKALQDARRNLESNPSAMTRLGVLAHQLGLES